MRIPISLCLLGALTALLAGCSASPEPQSAAPPPASTPASTSNSPYVSGAPDTAGAVPGSANAMYVFRFKQTDPSSANFTFRDRDVSFYFRPSPTALYFQVENLQGRPISINWDDCQFLDVNGRLGKVAHSPTRWKDRFTSQSLTLVGGQQRYGDYVFPIEYLVEPGAAPGTDEQPHLPIVPEDASAPNFSGRAFGVDLAMTVLDRPVTYSFRFQVASVIPR
jgi:hypothetical protein